jgi:hypothetical protein
MKTFTTKLKSSLLLSALMSLPLWAKPVAQVTQIQGSVFAISADGKTLALKVDSRIEDKSELMLEEGASITLNDYYDATYHLIGGTHLKFFDKSVQLKRGKVWIESGTTRSPLALTTANGSVDFWKSDFIASFDQSHSRSQFLVVNGEVEVSNVLDKNLKYTVPAGSFSLIDPEVENGAPRAPTKVGLASLNQSLSEFKQIPEQLKATAPSPKREIASVEEKGASPVKKGEIIFMSKGRLPASVQGGAHTYFTKKITKKKVASSGGIVVRFFGTKFNESKPVEGVAKAPEAPRSPASLRPINITPSPKNLEDDFNLDNEFDSSLKKEVEEQPKYSKELDSLIKDLKSY